MNKIGIYYAYWTRDWDVEFEPFTRLVASLGFDQLETNSGTVAALPSARRNRLKQAAEDSGISLSYCIGLPEKYDVSAVDPATRARGIRYLNEQIRAIGEMGGGSLSGIIYASWPMKQTIDFADKRPYWDRSVKSIQEASVTAEGENVILNVEVVNRFEQFLLNTSAEAVSYVKEVDSPNVKILLDTFHMNIEESSIEDAVLTAGNHLGHIHLGENNRTPPGCGRGHIPWPELGKALKAIDYHGALVMEPFLVPGGQVGRDIKVFRDLSIGMNMDEEARKACAFMKQTLIDAGL